MPRNGKKNISRKKREEETFVRDGERGNKGKENEIERIQ
jgi:hypothetical protein